MDTAEILVFTVATDGPETELTAFSSHEKSTFHMGKMKHECYETLRDLGSEQNRSSGTRA
jgi:hypothetical protein